MSKKIKTLLTEGYGRKKPMPKKTKKKKAY
jgi:hypothetical protein